MEDGRLHWVWQRRGRRDRSRPLGVVLGGLAGSVWFKQQRHLGHIVAAIQEVLPAGLSEHLAVDGLRRNVLHLRTDSAAHRYELEMIKLPLLAALNEQVNGVFIRDIRLSLGRLDEPPPPGARPDERRAGAGEEGG